MTGRWIGFIIWSICGLLFICLGIFALFFKNAMGFWANAKMFEVTDVKKYNRAMAKLFSVFGIVFILLGLPLLLGKNAALILVSVIGVMFETIAVMVVYTTVVEKELFLMT